MRLASAMPRSKVTPGTTRDSAKATPSKVLWSSLRTITSHGRSWAEPSPRSIRGSVREGVAAAMALLYRPPVPPAPRRADLEHVAGVQVEDRLGGQAAPVRSEERRVGK